MIETSQVREITTFSALVSLALEKIPQPIGRVAIGPSVASVLAPTVFGGVCRARHLRRWRAGGHHHHGVKPFP